MSKNYMPEVAKLLGVEIEEEFDVFIENGEKAAYCPYKITNNAIVDCEGDACPSLLYDLLTSKYTLQKRPWRPKQEDEYWAVCPDGGVGCWTFNCRRSDLATLNMGNCFPSREAALAKKYEILSKFEEIKKGVRE